MPAPKRFSLYEVLGVEKTATHDEVRKAYKKKALATHPDRAPQDQKEQAEEAFRAVSAAYEILVDEEKRREYDERGDPPTEEERAQQRRQRGASRPGFPDPRRRETFGNGRAYDGDPDEDPRYHHRGESYSHPPRMPRTAGAMPGNLHFIFEDEPSFHSFHFMDPFSLFDQIFEGVPHSRLFTGTFAPPPMSAFPFDLPRPDFPRSAAPRMTSDGWTPPAYDYSDRVGYMHDYGVSDDERGASSRRKQHRSASGPGGAGYPVFISEEFTYTNVNGREDRRWARQDSSGNTYETRFDPKSGKDQLFVNGVPSKGLPNRPPPPPPLSIPQYQPAPPPRIPQPMSAPHVGSEPSSKDDGWRAKLNPFSKRHSPTSKESPHHSRHGRSASSPNGSGPYPPYPVPPPPEVQYERHRSPGYDRMPPPPPLPNAYGQPYPPQASPYPPPPPAGVYASPPPAGAYPAPPQAGPYPAPLSADAYSRLPPPPRMSVDQMSGPPPSYRSNGYGYAPPPPQPHSAPHNKRGFGLFHHK